ncbi:MAG: hypothetical protein IKX98_03470 [Clostridia bacterium]|nr:hypothetical protein [Clostridia bacterium]MBR5769150.1 hypothetical protein [Clostridia bacterium]
MGAEAVIEKITARATAEAEHILASGKAAADKRAAEAAEAAEAEKEAILAAGRAEADAIRYREKLKAELDVRKNTLGEKRALLDRVYSAVREKLSALPEGEKAELYAKLAASFAMGESVKVYASPDMRAFAEANASRWGGAFAGEIKGSGAVLLSGDRCDADLSVDAIVADLRERTESDAARILFGE